MREAPNLRNEKQNEYYLYHKGALDRAGIAQSEFTIKTAFRSNISPLPGKNIQLFDGELKKNKDLYIELFEKVKDDNEVVVDYTPYDNNRPLFIYKANPHYRTEYPIKTGGDVGKEYDSYLVNLSELKVLWKGKTMTYAEYEKAKEQALPPAKEQNGVNDLYYFPNFEEEFPSLKEDSDNDNQENLTLSNISLRDFAAIMLVKPVSDKQWLNELIKQAKSEI